MDKEIYMCNRNKIAYLYSYGIFEERIERIERDGKIMYAFVYVTTRTVIDLLEEYSKDDFLKKFTSNFKQVAVAIAKEKSRE